MIAFKPGTIVCFEHVLDDPRRPPETVPFRVSGMLYARRAPGGVVRGNCVSVVVTELESA